MLVAALAWAAVGPRGHALAQGGRHRATVLIAFGDGRTTTHCVSFDEDQISGAELLQRAGLEVRFTEHQGFGAGVCAIEGVGCADTPDCFCRCRGTPCAYWSYWLWQDGRWVYSQQGASRQPVRDGDIQGWLWGDAQSPPTAAAPDPICPPTDVSPAATATPTPPVRPSGAPLAQYGAFVALLALLGAALWWRARQAR